MSDYTKILKECEDYVTQYFALNNKGQVFYHNLKHTKRTVGAAKLFSSSLSISDREKSLLEIAAWFHDIGYLIDYKNHEDVSAKEAEDFLLSKELATADIGLVKQLIISTKITHKPNTLLEEILHDADYETIGKKRFFTQAEMLRLEWENNLDLVYTEAEWQEKQLEFLSDVNFYTQVARKELGERRAKNIIKQRKLFSKTSRKSKKIGRGIETMYRAVYRNHINLSDMADNKANIMISINTILVSILVAGIGSGFTFSGKDFIEHIRFTIPMSILLVCSLISVAFAVVSASPNVTNKNINKSKVLDQKSSALFFGNYVNLELQKFVDILTELRLNQENVYDNMSVDLYHLGHVLQRKYGLLRKSYFTFLGGLSLCVLSFVVILFLSI